MKKKQISITPEFQDCFVENNDKNQRIQPLETRQSTLGNTLVQFYTTVGCPLGATNSFKER